jgi:hypothetical protein
VLRVVQLYLAALQARLDFANDDGVSTILILLQRLDNDVLRIAHSVLLLDNCVHDSDRFLLHTDGQVNSNIFQLLVYGLLRR